MNFDEKSDYSIRISDLPTSFVYFLLDGDEVVYVGQTSVGIYRPIAHLHSEKVFDRIEIIKCPVIYLDEIEGKLILKYRPKYNKTIVGSGFIGIRKAKEIGAELSGNESYSKWNLKRDMKELEEEFVNFKGVNFIREDFIGKLYKKYVDDAGV